MRDFDDPTNFEGCKAFWRRGWELNPRMEVLQTSPLGHLGTAPEFRSIAKLESPCQRPHEVKKI
jgi:hypothetical protein